MLSVARVFLKFILYPEHPRTQQIMAATCYMVMVVQLCAHVVTGLSSQQLHSLGLGTQSLNLDNGLAEKQ